jgi:hypothetical protein
MAHSTKPMQTPTPSISTHTGMLNHNNQTTATVMLKHQRPIVNTRPNGEATMRTRTEGAACMGGGASGNAQARRNTSVPLVPPNPKLFLAAYSIFICRAVLAQ